MPAKCFLGALLLVAAGAGSAEPLTWRFSFTGFYDELTGRFDREHVVAGEFSGEDLNGDDVIDNSELTSMLIYGEQNYRACQGDESPYHVCGVGPFYFGPGNDLSFSVGEESHDRLRQQGGGHEIDTYDRDWSYLIENGVEKPYRYYSWTARTALQVSLVPEPGGWAMLAGGAGLLAALRARRTRRRTPG